MRFAYADPPYLGQCRLYGHSHPAGPRPFDGACWDDEETHRALIHWLASEFPDGWALSASSPSLIWLASMVPGDTRIGAWGKTFCAFKKGVRPAYAWEPVFYRSHANPPHRKHAPPERGGKQTTPKDFLACRITLERGLTGAKPAEFCRWVLDLLNAKPTDEIVDVFPGTGAMGRAIDEWRRQQVLPLATPGESR